MERIRTDILVIGAGSGGLSVAAGASRMGAKVVLLEGGRMGGDCLNYGCVPSKALIAAAGAAWSQARASRFGIANVAPQVDYAAVMAHVAEVIARIAPVDSQERFEGLGVRVIRDYGRFVSRAEVQAGDHLISARRFVIATGSAPLVPPIPGLDAVPYLTNETLFDLRDRPDHLLILGGGPVGMEMAQAHVRLGSRVTVIEAERALGKDDRALADLVLEALRRDGVEIVEGAEIVRARDTGERIEVAVRDGRVFAGSHLLVAAGRRASTDRLNLAAAGIETTRTGIRVDRRLRTSNRRVHAIGDVAGGLQFTHVAGYQASVVLRAMLFGLPARAETGHIPRVTYTDPELAQIGLTETQARDRHGARLEVVQVDYTENDRAVASRRAAGAIKVMVVRGRPVGVSIAGPDAGEAINVWALVLANRMKMRQVAGMVAAYPTLGEINKRAAGAYFSSRLFDNPVIGQVVGAVQRWLP